MPIVCYLLRPNWSGMFILRALSNSSSKHFPGLRDKKGHQKFRRLYFFCFFFLKTRVSTGYPLLPKLPWSKSFGEQNIFASRANTAIKRLCKQIEAQIRSVATNRALLHTATVGEGYIRQAPRRFAEAKAVRHEGGRKNTIMHARKK